MLPPILTVVLETNVTPSAGLCALAAMVGTVGVTFMQLRKGTSITKTIGKVFMAFGCGYYLGGNVSMVFNVDKLAGSFLAAASFQTIMQVWESKFKKEPSQ